MAFWLIEANINLGARDAFWTPENSLLRHIELVLQAGHNVQIIVWYPNAKARLVIDEQTAQHDKLARDIANIDLSVRRTLHGRCGRALVYRERYEGLLGGSQHQKMAIFANNGQRTVIVGGMNMAVRYFDTRAHNQRSEFVDPSGTPRQRYAN